MTEYEVTYTAVVRGKKTVPARTPEEASDEVREMNIQCLYRAYEPGSDVETLSVDVDAVETIR